MMDESLTDHLMMSFSLVLACTACPLFCVKWMRSTPYLGGIVMDVIGTVKIIKTTRERS